MAALRAEMRPRAALAGGLRPGRGRGWALAAAALLCFTPGLLAAAAPAAQPAAPAGIRGRLDGPVSLDAASSQVDYRTNTVVFTDVVISQGDARVAADKANATGLDFEKSTWVFTGNVRINAQGGTLHSDQATVGFAANQIATATIVGKPAEFEHLREGTTEPAHGHAASIEYDFAAGTVRLQGDAWLSDGRNEISGQQLVYDMKQQRVNAPTQGGPQGRVRITIRPRESAPAPATAPTPAPAPTAPAPAPAQ